MDKQKLKIGGLLIFKKGLRPEWEEKVCGNGGLFLFKVNFDDDNLLEEVWDTLVQSMVCGVIPHTELICGIRLIEKFGNFKFEIWTTHWDLEKGGDSLKAKHSAILEQLERIFDVSSRGGERKILSDVKIAFGKHGDI
jgi:hypothetical protein